ncbi:AGE family epimerase/isomerase [Sporanaerobium hydrogeniformans]|uniref:AGE family epimerase/isomerase n=1 Tax=Sporanaerobium hydrogeniformans TaxID=3072179 RepID=UPI00268745F2|nr:AGE family epimerase/isomerase [Sporanaerobium hydrogeniformans]
MIAEIKQNLLETISPFWKKLKDEKWGGFYGLVNYDLELDKKAPKGVILNSRILWYFANQYLLLANEEDLTYARHAYTFLKDYCLDKEYGGVYWMMSYDGKVIEDMKHTYNQAFAIYALSSYYDATKEQEALDIAYTLFYKIEKVCREKYGYGEAFTKEWKATYNNKLSDNRYLCSEGIIAEKTMNTLLHILEAYTEFYRVTKDKKVKERLEDLLVIFKNYVYNENTESLEVFFDNHMQSITDLHSYGHDIEAAWLLDRAAEIVEEEALIQMTKAYTIKLAYKIKEVAFEEGALNNERYKKQIDKTKVWWIQSEGIVGFINAYEKTGDEAFLELAAALWQYIQTYLIDKRSNSEWYWEVNEKGEPISKKAIVEPWKCPYHNGRMCFEVMRRNKDV